MNRALLASSNLNLSARDKPSPNRRIPCYGCQQMPSCNNIHLMSCDGKDSNNEKLVDLGYDPKMGARPPAKTIWDHTRMPSYWLLPWKSMWKTSRQSWQAMAIFKSNLPYKIEKTGKRLLLEILIHYIICIVKPNVFCTFTKINAKTLLLFSSISR